MKKRLWIGFIVVLIISAISGCAQKEQKKLTLGVMADVGAVPFLIAQEQKLYEKHNIDVDIQVFRSALDRDAALQSGALDGVMADMLTIFFYQNAGVDVKMTSQTFGDYIMVSAPGSTKESFLSTEKIEIGLSSNTVIEFATEQIASQLGFDQKLTKVAIPQMPVRLQLLGSGEITGATLPDPLAAAAMMSGAKIGSTSELNLYPGIFIMNGRALRDKTDAIKNMYLAYNDAVDYLNKTELNVYFPLLEEQLGFPGPLQNTYKMPIYEKAVAPDASTFDVTRDWLLERELIQDIATYDAVSDLSFIQ